MKVENGLEDVLEATLEETGGRYTLKTISLDERSLSVMAEASNDV